MIDKFLYCDSHFKREFRKSGTRRVVQPAHSQVSPGVDVTGTWGGLSETMGGSSPLVVALRNIIGFSHVIIDSLKHQTPVAVSGRLHTRHTLDNELRGQGEELCLHLEEAATRKRTESSVEERTHRAKRMTRRSPIPQGGAYILVHQSLRDTVHGDDFTT
ncbi:hypothetical protein C0Q70_02166 [Pomacea canaliculata]|uniref:Uncharacterized protein n=1 Tax=Pomacea canaliculata TaxID=400727 RepID=A0A2T7Q1H2_POMCA|nr:hypothetical protein C0Q70_02166 [Pomacea canaliculata]